MYVVTIRTEISGHALPATDAPSALTIVRSIEAQNLEACVVDQQGRRVPLDQLRALAAGPTEDSPRKPM